MSFGIVFIRLSLILAFVASIVCIVCAFLGSMPWLILVGLGGMFQCFMVEVFLQMHESLIGIKKNTDLHTKMYSQIEDRLYDVVDRVERLAK